MKLVKIEVVVEVRQSDRGGCIELQLDPEAGGFLASTSVEERDSHVGPDPVKIVSVEAQEVVPAEPGTVAVEALTHMDAGKEREALARVLANWRKAHKTTSVQGWFCSLYHERVVGLAALSGLMPETVVRDLERDAAALNAEEEVDPEELPVGVQSGICECTDQDSTDAKFVPDRTGGGRWVCSWCKRARLEGHYADPGEEIEALAHELAGSGNEAAEMPRMWQERAAGLAGREGRTKDAVFEDLEETAQEIEEEQLAQDRAAHGA